MDDIQIDLAGLIGQDIYVYICKATVQVFIAGTLKKTNTNYPEYYVKNDEYGSHIYFNLKDVDYIIGRQIFIKPS